MLHGLLFICVLKKCNNTDNSDNIFYLFANIISDIAGRYCIPASSIQRNLRDVIQPETTFVITTQL